MKPPPVLDQPVDQTYSVANLHFADLAQRYGPIVSTRVTRLMQTIVNLSEQNGREGLVTNGYEELVNNLGRGDVK